MEMKHYKDAEGKLYGFPASGSHDHLMPEGLTEISLSEAHSQGIVKYQEGRDQEIAQLDYLRQRIHAYPEIGEFLDAWVKNDKKALEEYRKKCLEVKSKYPKPMGF